MLLKEVPRSVSLLLMLGKLDVQFDKRLLNLGVAVI
jgi:hypothetical protein